MKSSQGAVPKKRKAIAGYVTKILVFGADVLFSFFAFLLALFVTNKSEPAHFLDVARWVIPVLLALRGVAFYLFRTHRLIIRYVGERDYLSVFLAITASSALFWALLSLLPGLVPAREVMLVVLIDWMALLVFSIGARILLRLILNQQRQQRSGLRNTAIFGAGELGNMLMKVLRHNDSHDYRLVAFFDDNPKVHNKVLDGVPVFNPDKSFAEAVRKKNIETAIIGINGLPEERRIRFIQECLEHNIQVLKVPPTEDWLNNHIQLGQLQNIRFEDLLNRPPIQLDEARISENIDGQVVLVTGCAGSIGSEIVRQLLRYRPRCIIGVDQAETPLAEATLALQKEVESGLFHPIIGDVKDYEHMEALFQRYRPQFVFHAAAYKHVPIMERFPAAAIKANVEGTRNVANLSSRYGARKFVMVSTDKVVNPANVMGASKRIAEIYVQSLNAAPGNETQFITTRFGNVLGSNGSVIPIFKQQIEQRGPVTVTDPKVTRFFMTIPEACQLVLEAGAMGKGGEIFVFDMGEPVRIVELAERMIQMAGLRPNKDIDIIYTGLRPGEKLYEELLDAQEGLIRTHHDKIRKATVRPCGHLDVRRRIHQLIDMAYNGHDGQELVGRMKEIVPEYKSRNSVFAELDGPGGKQVPAK